MLSEPVYESKNALRILPAGKITLEGLHYRYPMRAPIVLEAELRQIEKCLSYGFKRLELESLKQETMCVVGYGPSLHETWKEITHPCVTVSGSHDFLIERGVIPDFHAECDGRDYKPKHLEKPNEATTYLMASVCNPKMWEQLKGHDVRVWHNAGGKHVVDWIGKNDDGGLLVAGGSNIGLASIHLTGILGYRNFKVFGLDGNLKSGKRHAGPHYGQPQKIIKHTVNGRTWETTPQMYNACEEMLFLMDDKNVKIQVVGESLLRDMVINKTK